MKKHSPCFWQIALLAGLTVGSVGSIKAVWGQSVAAPQKVDLAANVGKEMTVQGRLTQLQNGRIGIVVSGIAHSEQISIDALPCPERGELPFTLLVTEQGQSVKHPKYRRHSQRGWIATDARLKKLDSLIASYRLGDSVELTGKLCHFTTSIRGNVQGNIHYPRLPDSHYFFSVDDLKVTLKK